ncbi:MAG: TonB-dependent receptor, partial [Rudaea sp.]|nr:TonB-dependent receptor [Rudaea sp.]
SLRGLGSVRTLVLLDGRRLQVGGTTADVNAIPANLIERIEVLTDGASAIYGSDAIGGVVNVITRKNFQGVEVSGQYGISDRDDGARRGFNLTIGQTGDRGSVMGGIDYNKQDQILAGLRDYSRYSYTRNATTGAVSFTGSTSAPTGFIRAPVFSGCPNIPEGGNVPGGTFDSSAAGGNGIPKGFRCFQPAGAGGLGDLYNFAAVNLISTPSERTNAFIKGNYKLTDSVEAYMSTLYNKTDSAFQIASLPISLYSTGVVISSQNPYNPFGIDIGTSSSRNASLRLTALGPRRQAYNTENNQVVAGLHGKLFETSWEWDANIGFGKFSANRTRTGYLNAAALTQNGALGAKCTPVSAGLSNTTCLNILDQSDPNTAALLQKYYGSILHYHSLQIQRQANISANGDLFALPAGNVSMAAGLSYRKQYVENDADQATIADPKNGGRCGGIPETCTSPFSGNYNVKEAYAELLVPLLRDLPFVHSANLIVGDRYSKYSSFGSTNNWKVAVEYKPIEDLLLRGTVSRVFRAPNLTETSAALQSSYDNYVSPGPGFGSSNGNQVQVLFSGANVAGLPIKPETGSTFDFGFVYDPHWLEGLSFSADLWRIYLNNMIDRPRGQTIANLCYASGASRTSPFCKFINFSEGQIDSMSGVAYTNLGRLDASGADFGSSYRVPETPYGNFRLGLKATYYANYDNVPTPGAPVVHLAGGYNSQYGNFARWRAVGSVDWSMGDFSASWRQRYQSRVHVFALGAYHVGAWTRNDISAGYNLSALNTRIDVGIDNVGDKQPPLFYQAVTNANVDVNTYDTIGRYFWGRITVKF